MAENSTMRSCFVVWNNPEWHYTYKHNEDGTLCKDENGKNIILKQEKTCLNGMSHSDMCQHIVNRWCETKKGRTAYAAYCISAEGHHHIHCVFECDSKDSFRYTQIQNLFGVKFHADITRGNKKQVEDYILKQGKFEEKGEVVETTYQHGELKGNQGNRTDLQSIEEAIKKGMKPKAIMSESIAAIRFEKIIKKAYYLKRDKETPTIRDVKVVWHFGKSGTGKSFYTSKLIEKYGDDSVYKLSDYQNGGFDNYSGEEILVLEEFRGDLRYNYLLQILDRYKTEFHARFANILGLWNEVHILSVLNPKQVYQRIKMNEDLLSSDSEEQLLRRISEMHYHYKTKKGEYKTYICRNFRPILELENFENDLAVAIELGKTLSEDDEII